MQEKSSAFYTTLVFIHAETGPTVKHLQWQGLQPQGPQIPTDIRTCPPYALWLLWEQGAQGTASCLQQTWISSHLHRFYPCVELHLINTSVRKGESW